MSARKTLAAALALGALGWAAPAKAQGLSGLRLHAGLGGAMALSSHARDTLGFGPALSGSLRASLRLAGPLAVQASGGYGWFPSEQGYGYLSTVGLGPRVSLAAGPGNLVLDANVGLGRTRASWRAALDLGVGYGFAAGSNLHVGPVLRYGQVVHGAEDFPADLRYVTLGVELSLGFTPAPAPEAPPPPPPPPPPTPPPEPEDQDSDGVEDAEDRCPREPVGRRPDPARRGCPLQDTDGDGVYDDTDRCPGQAQGPTPDPERVGCPDGDDDNDAVTNHGDLCPHEPAGFSPDPERLGCPGPDRDGDSVIDRLDACPDRPGAPSAEPRRNGCPGLVVVAGGLVQLRRPVFFVTDSDELLSTSTAVLTAAAEALRLATGIRRVRIEGHTDSTGDAGHNLELSQRRAASVRFWLTDHGVDASRLESQGFGQTRPLRPNIGARNRAQNRRVEFHIVDPPAPARPQRPARPRGRRR
ncbi:MAG: OmpA family protein [Deltaproteobacteria bacterium]|nr:OmpA family protein [Deltaproteobacteria bacterium]